MKMKKAKFICPDCGSENLGQLQNVMTTYRITNIPEDGNLDYDHCNPQTGDGEVLSHQCMDCGYELRDKDGNVVDDCLKVYEAVKKLNNQ